MGIFYFISIGVTQAQTFCLRISEVSNDGLEYVVKIEINGDAAFNLGSSNFQFSYNEAALGTPILASSSLGVDNGYLIPTVILPLPGFTSLNIEYNGLMPGIEIAADQTYFELATLSFPIIDEATIGSLEWNYDGGSTGTFAFLDDEITQIFATEETCLVGIVPLSAPDCVTVVSPLDGADDVATDNLSFEWLLQETGAPETGIRIYIDTDSSFVSNTFIETINGTTQQEIGGLDFSTIYYWSVIPFNEEGEATDCEVFSFSTRDEPNGLTCATAFPVGEGIFTDPGPTAGSGASNACFTGATNASWYAYTASVSDSIFVASSIDPDLPNTRLTIHSDCLDLDCIASDDNSGTGFTSFVKFFAVAGETYYIEWDDRLSNSDFDFQIALPIYGCLIPEACNYNEDANTKDASCIFASECDTCSGETDGTGTVVDNPEVGETCEDFDDNTIDDIIGDDCVCGGTPIINFGCADATACNYNDAGDVVEDGSCIYFTGCDTCSGETDGTGTVVDNLDLGEACDDGDAITADDMIQADCSCSGIIGPGSTFSDAIPVTEGITMAADIKGGGGASNACSNLALNAIWYVYTATVSDVVTISSSIDLDQPDTRVSVHSGAGNFDCLASDDDDGEGFTSLTSFMAVAGESYLIEWDDRWNDGEFDFEISIPNPCPTDINRDGITNGDDFGLFLGNFGLNCNPSTTCLTDFDGNGTTDGIDFGLFLGNFGLACEPPVPCPTDFDSDETTNGNDFSIFLGNFGLDCDPNLPCPTDLDGNGTTNGDDFSVFLGNYGLDCN